MELDGASYREKEAPERCAARIPNVKLLEPDTMRASALRGTLDDRLGSSEVCCSTPWPPCRQRFVSGLLRRVWVWGAVITAPCGAFHSWIGAFTTALARPSHCPSLSSSWPSGCEKRPTSRSQCCETNVNAPSTPQRTTASAARRDVHVLPHFRRRRYKRAATTLELLGSDVLAVVGAPSYMSTMR
jgi:hypothetical protein